MTGGIKIVCEANLGSLGGLSEGMADMYSLDKMTYSEPVKRNYVNLDTGMWAGGVTSLVTPASGHNTEGLRSVTPGPGGRGIGRGNGRRIKEEEGLLDPEEEEKRRVRRERNKLAAARCRKRRVDQIDTLQRDVEEWEERKRLLQEEIVSLQQQREEFQFILQAHKRVCSRQSQDSQAETETVSVTVSDITGVSGQFPGHQVSGPRVVTVKTEPELEPSFSSCDQFSVTSVSEPESDLSSLDSFSLVSTSASSIMRPQRPVSLSLTTLPLRSIEGVSIDTPSTCLNFDSLLDGRTGLTPTNILNPIHISSASSASSLQTPSLVSVPGASCGSQTRGHSGTSITASMSELASPTTNSPNLVSL